MFKLRTSLTLILLALFGFSISIQGKNKEEEGLKNKAIWKVKLGQIYQFYSEDQFITRRGSKFELFQIKEDGIKKIWDLTFFNKFVWPTFEKGIDEDDYCGLYYSMISSENQAKFRLDYIKVDERTKKRIWSYESDVWNITGETRLGLIKLNSRVLLVGLTNSKSLFNLQGFNLETGQKKWSLNCENYLKSIAYKNNVLVVISSNNLSANTRDSKSIIRRINYETGEILWQKTVSGVNNNNGIGIAGNTVIVTTDQRIIYGLDISNGDILWSKTTQRIPSKVSVFDENQQIVITAEKLLSLDEQGNVFWERTIEDRYHAWHTYLKGKYYLWTYKYLWVVDAANGVIIKKHTFKDSIRLLKAVKGRIIIFWDSGLVQCFDKSVFEK